MQALWDSLVQLVGALVNVVVSAGGLILPWTALIAWIGFWLFAVNWVKLRSVLLSGGWTGLALIGFVWILVWGVVAPPADGTHFLLGLSVSNFVGKTVYVTTLICIMLLCGAVQLSGLVDGCVDFSRFEVAFEEHGHGDHGHDSHGHDNHGHDSHGHAPVHATAEQAHH